MFDGSEFEIFYHQNIADLPSNATETEHFSNTCEFSFFEKNYGFLEKNSNCFKIAKSGKIAVECVSNDIIS